MIRYYYLSVQLAALMFCIYPTVETIWSNNKSYMMIPKFQISFSYFSLNLSHSFICSSVRFLNFVRLLSMMEFACALWFIHWLPQCSSGVCFFCLFRFTERIFTENIYEMHKRPLTHFDELMNYANSIEFRTFECVELYDDWVLSRFQ